MKNLTPLLLLMMAPASLLAHPGDHSGSPAELGWHWLTQPDHLILGVTTAALAIGLGIYLYNRRRRDA